MTTEQQTAVETPASTRTSFQEWEALPADQQNNFSSEGENVTASETAPASEPETKVETEEKPKTDKAGKGLRKRFQQLTSEIRDLRAQLGKPAAAETGSQPTKETKTETAPDQTGKPVAANFNTYDEYVEALTDWKMEKAQAAREAAAAQVQQQQTVKTQVEAARARHADYDQVVNDKVPISQSMAEALIASEHGAEVAYHLGKNLAECKRIAALPPVKAALEIAKIERGLNLETPGSTETPKPKTSTSKAPAPPKTVKGGGADADPEPDAKNFASWEKWYDRQQKKKQAE